MYIVSECMIFNMELSGANILAISNLLKTAEPESDSDEDMKVFFMWLVRSRMKHKFHIA